MTPEDLVAEARRQVGASKRPATKAELWLAAHLEEALKGCSVAFLRSHAILNGRSNAELPALNLDRKAIDEVAS